MKFIRLIVNLTFPSGLCLEISWVILAWGMVSFITTTAMAVKKNTFGIEFRVCNKWVGYTGAPPEEGHWKYVKGVRIVQGWKP